MKAQGRNVNVKKQRVWNSFNSVNDYILKAGRINNRIKSCHHQLSPIS